MHFNSKASRYIFHGPGFKKMYHIHKTYSSSSIVLTRADNLAPDGVFLSSNSVAVIVAEAHKNGVQGGLCQLANECSSQKGGEIKCFNLYGFWLWFSAVRLLKLA